MAFAPVLPAGGLTGYRFLQRTHADQLATYLKSPEIEREIAYFRDHAGAATDAGALVGDRRLLAVVLGAFGLDDDIDKRAFLRKVLDEGTATPDAFANRLVEPAYRDMAATLGFGDFGGLLIFEGTREDIIARYRERQFERALGEVDIDMRLALNFRREAARIGETADSDRTAWLRLLGSRPLRQVIEGALGLPDSFALVDLDRQVAEIERRGAALIDGPVRDGLTDPATLDAIIRRYLLNAQASAGAAPAVAGSAALDLLRAAGLGTAASQSLFASGFL